MKTYKKYYQFNASPEQLYITLTNPATIQLWTGEAATMNTEPGSEFSLWGDSIVGKNLEFIPNKKIVQEWYFGEQPQPSIVTIILHSVKDGTSLELRHSGIPDEDYDDIVEGWNNNYFASLEDFFD